MCSDSSGEQQSQSRTAGHPIAPWCYSQHSYYTYVCVFWQVLENLRGVAANHEFFQRDNYRVLVQARRSLVRDMEHLYQQQPSLAAVRRTKLPSGGGGGGSGTVHHKPMDVVLEGALLSLGRCLDLVRPAGLLTGPVRAQDFRLAFQLLEQTVAQISEGCDPDRPLPAADWGLLLLLPSQQQQAPSASSSKGEDTARSEGAKGRRRRRCGS